MTLPTVAVIIPCYQSLNTIKNCIDSIKKQDYPETLIHIYVILNGEPSKKQMYENQLKHLPRVSILTSPTKGRSRARNFGEQCSQSDLLAFIDSDVVLDPSWISLGVKKLMQSSTISAVFGDIIPSGKHSTLNEFRNNIFNKRKLSKRIHFNSAAFLIKRKPFRVNGGFSSTFARAEDTYFFINFLISNAEASYIAGMKSYVYWDHGPLNYFIKRPFTSYFYLSLLSLKLNWSVHIKNDRASTEPIRFQLLDTIMFLVRICGYFIGQFFWNFISKENRLNLNDQIFTFASNGRFLTCQIDPFFGVIEQDFTFYLTNLKSFKRIALTENDRLLMLETKNIKELKSQEDFLSFTKLKNFGYLKIIATKSERYS